MKILSFDPSGNFIEGSGTTGWVLYYEDIIKTLGQIKSFDYTNQVDYWIAHLDLIKALAPDILVVEEYVLYAHTSRAQIGSQMETVQLIGILKYFAKIHNIPIVFQSARIKKRFNNEILLHKNILTQDSQKRYYAAGMPVSQHIIDAIRHGEFYKTFTRKKELK